MSSRNGPKSARSTKNRQPEETNITVTTNNTKNNVDKNNHDDDGDDDDTDDFLHCPCCQNEYNQPKMLPCLHSFCYECLESNLTQNGIGPGEAFLCPICKTQCVVPARGVRAMKSNIFLVTLQEFFHSKTLDPETECEACDSGRAARKKCIECSDWLCNQCCAMHLKVKMTKDHHLVSPSELESGQYDQLIKESFEPLLCSKHNEPLKLYCRDLSCQAPICTVCKTTPAHEQHDAIELTEQAKQEAGYIKSLMPATRAFITTTAEKITTLEIEEKSTIQIRKKLHKAINDRTQEVVERVVRRIQHYAESVLLKVEEMSKEHRKDLVAESEACRNKLQAAVSARSFAEALLSFDRPEELVSMSREVRSRLEDFQTPVDPMPPAWKEPRLNPAAAMVDGNDEGDDDQLVARLFGELTFEGEAMSRSVPVAARAFSARWTHDEKECALCDVTLDAAGNIIVVDKDNRRIKVFDSEGRLKMLSDEAAELKSPNRVLWLRNSGQILVKDEKYLKLFGQDGRFVGLLTEKLKQPVGLAQNEAGDILVTEWMAGEVVTLDQEGKRMKSFPVLCEAAGYITCCPNGNIVVSDWKQHVIKIFDANGRFLKQYGGQGSGDNQLDHPYGVCSDRFSHIIVSDTWNNRVVLLSEDGRYIKTIVGKMDGIEWPQAVAVDKYGRLLVVEQHGLVKFFQYLA
ncbi:hypothetical protein HELRODRAFT_179784 [Helobdella robusta]|uniref:RING-type domain-containing protein n=1 Tax=Helobdella robusta TaxID=6412 RepID=T1FF55_HELRO|nr:hypothetical protein HELRODRAFT_179784 [Helobdella robusta]ESN95184.1 hypothetical protein HELRODRAFT_179784 [Helobdella robusta]